MAADYKSLNNNITTAIKDHLMNVDELPTTEVPKLATEITRLVFVELDKSGLTEDAFNRIGTTATPRAAAQGKA